MEECLNVVVPKGKHRTFKNVRAQCGEMRRESGLFAGCPDIWLRLQHSVQMIGEPVSGKYDLALGDGVRFFLVVGGKFARSSRLSSRPIRFSAVLPLRREASAKIRRNCFSVMLP